MLKTRFEILHPIMKIIVTNLEVVDVINVGACPYHTYAFWVTVSNRGSARLF